MKVLYIEDDIIDQMAVRRLADKCSCELLFVNSIKEANDILQAEKFDLIISDFNLGDGTAEDVLKLVTNQKIILITDKPLDSFNANGNLLYSTTKPINESIFKITNKSQPLDLTYFNSLTEGDINFQVELLDTALQILPSALEKVNEAFESLNFAQLKFEAHKMKSGARVIGIPILETLQTIEALALTGDLSRLTPLIDELNQKASSGIDLVKIEREKLQ